MQLAAKILEYGLLAWFGLLTLLIAVRILRRDIEVAGLLTQRSGDQSVLPERARCASAHPVRFSCAGKGAGVPEGGASRVARDSRGCLREARSV